MDFIYFHNYFLSATNINRCQNNRVGKVVFAFIFLLIFGREDMMFPAMDLLSMIEMSRKSQER